MTDDDHVDPFYDALMRSGPTDSLVGPEDLLAAFLRPPAWHREAACRGVGSAVFFPARGESLDPARSYCDRCPVTAECGEAGDGRDGGFGVWGGMSAQQRKVGRRSQAA